MGAADFMALADTLRDSADEMELYGHSNPEDILALRDSADECDEAAMRMVGLVQEKVA